jgi:hypothetical protein
MAAILAWSNSLSVVVSPTLDFSRAIFVVPFIAIAFFQSRSPPKPRPSYLMTRQFL